MGKLFAKEKDQNPILFWEFLRNPRSSLSCLLFSICTCYSLTFRFRCVSVLR